MPRFVLPLLLALAGLILFGQGAYIRAKALAVGDEIDIVRSDGRKFRYRAYATAVVRFDASGIDPLADGYELVLSTCWPFEALTPGPERYLLHATMIGAEPGSH